MSSQTFIEMRNIVKTFKTPVGEFTALKGVNADFRRGEFVSVVGKSGSGKSTLVNMLTGIDHPTSGEVRIGDTYVHKLNESQMARWRGRNLGIVFQFYQLLPMLSLLENVILPMDFAELYSPAERERRALELLDLVGLADLAHEMPAQVAGGQQQSAAIARALANDPPLIVADEPTGNLDSHSAERVFQIFAMLARQGKTIVMVTHDNALADRAQRKLVLADGEVVDEAIVNTLPWLSHRQMLRATKSAQRQRFAPGETIIRRGQPHHHLYIIANGTAQVYLDDVAPIAELGPGQFFGEIELLEHRNGAVATIKAAVHSAVEVLALESHILGELMGEAATMREMMIQTMQQRLAQNAQFLSLKQRIYA